MKLFGTSGMRGVYGLEVNEEKIFEVANAFAFLSDSDVVLARDSRKTSIPLFHSALSGILTAGKNAVIIGIAPTPALAFATLKLEQKSGMMLTASHNPQEYGGLKLFRNGMEIGPEEENTIIEKIKHGLEIASWDATGTAKEDNSVLAKYHLFIESMINVYEIKKLKLKAVVDCNGAASILTPQVLCGLGCKVIALNSEKEGFNRPSEPTEKNLSALSKIVSVLKADIGIAHDGDGDRCIVVDDTGAVLPLDVQLAVMIEHQLKKNKNKRIVSTVEASLLVRETVERLGGELLITPVSSVHVAELLEDKKACFGGEPCGEYVFSSGTHAPDGTLTAAVFLEIISENGKLSELRKKYKQYPMLREKFKCENKYETIKKIIEKIKESGIGGKRNEEDGLRIDEDDGWFLIRASGTEPIIRLTIEYKNKKKLDERAGELRGVIQNCIFSG